MKNTSRQTGNNDSNLTTHSTTERIHLQGIGKVPAIRASAITIGTVLVWNHGYCSIVNRITPSKTGKSLYLETEALKYEPELDALVRTGERYKRTLRTTRLVAISQVRVAEDSRSRP